MKNHKLIAYAADQNMSRLEDRLKRYKEKALEKLIKDRADYLRMERGKYQMEYFSVPVLFRWQTLLKADLLKRREKIRHQAVELSDKGSYLFVNDDCSSMDFDDHGKDTIYRTQEDNDDSAMVPGTVNFRWKNPRTGEYGKRFFPAMKMLCSDSYYVELDPCAEWEEAYKFAKRNAELFAEYESAYTEADMEKGSSEEWFSEKRSEVKEAIKEIRDLCANVGFEGNEPGRDYIRVASVVAVLTSEKFDPGALEEAWRDYRDAQRSHMRDIEDYEYAEKEQAEYLKREGLLFHRPTIGPVFKPYVSTDTDDDTSN